LNGVEKVSLHFDIDGTDFSAAGNASASLKKTLRELGIPVEIIRRVSIPMYEGEINMVIHANGGTADVEISPEEIKIVLKDNGKGIEDIDLAMKEGYSTASEDIRNLGFGAGMGLPNMKKYTDELKIDSKPGKGTTVYMTVKIK
jgi:serine/threonine-protein kinase RsbT